MHGLMQLSSANSDARCERILMAEDQRRCEQMLTPEDQQFMYETAGVLIVQSQFTAQASL